MIVPSPHSVPLYVSTCEPHKGRFRFTLEGTLLFPIAVSIISFYFRSQGIAAPSLVVYQMCDRWPRITHNNAPGRIPWETSATQCAFGRHQKNTSAFAGPIRVGAQSDCKFCEMENTTLISPTKLSPPFSASKTKHPDRFTPADPHPKMFPKTHPFPPFPGISYSRSPTMLYVVPRRHLFLAPRSRPLACTSHPGRGQLPLRGGGNTLLRTHHDLIDITPHHLGRIRWTPNFFRAAPSRFFSPIWPPHHLMYFYFVLPHHILKGICSLW